MTLRPEHLRRERGVFEGECPSVTAGDMKPTGLSPEMLSEKDRLLTLRVGMQSLMARDGLHACMQCGKRITLGEPHAADCEYGTLIDKVDRLLGDTK